MHIFNTSLTIYIYIYISAWWYNSLIQGRENNYCITSKHCLL